MNEDLVERLKALDYESKFCETTGSRQISRSHFAFETANRDGQFKLFLQLVAWLLNEARADAEFEIEEYDDPNTSVTKMMLALKSTGFAMEVSTMKLKQGFGEAVLSVLGYLCDKALKGVLLRSSRADRSRTARAEPFFACLSSQPNPTSIHPSIHPSIPISHSQWLRLGQASAARRGICGGGGGRQRSGCGVCAHLYCFHCQFPRRNRHSPRSPYIPAHSLCCRGATSRTSLAPTVTTTT